MKKEIFILFVCIFYYCCGGIKKEMSQPKETNNNIDTLLAFHMKVLDSAMLNNTNNTVYCCGASIQYIEMKSGIPSSSDGTHLGRLSFKKRDWKRWHRWYVNIGRG